MRLPNRYGVIGKLSGKRRNPFVAKKFVMWETDDDEKKVRPVYKIVGYFPTRKAALEALAQENLNPKRSEKITFKQIYNEWYAKKTGTISASNEKNYRNAYKYFAPLHDEEFAGINTFDIEDAVEAMDVPRTMRKYCKMLLHQMYHYAIAHDICDKDYSKLANFGIDNEAQIERKIFTREEVDGLFERGDVFADMILVAIYSAMRPIEVCNLTTEEVDLDAGMFRLKGTKTKYGKNRLCPIHPKIIPIVQRNCLKRGKSDVTRVFCDKGKQVSYAQYYDAVTQVGHKPHDTKHTWGSYSAMCHVDEIARKEIMGHSQGKGNVTNYTYTHVSESWLKEEMNKYEVLIV